MFNERIAIRQSLFQATPSVSELHRKREQWAVGLRREKRQTSFKRRRDATQALNLPSSYSFNPDFVPQTLSELEPRMASAQFSAQHRLHLLLEFLKTSKDEPRTLDGLLVLRKVLSVDENVLDNEILHSRVTQNLLRFLNSEALRGEAVWCLINIACGPPVIIKMLLDLGTVPALLKLFESEDTDLCMNCVWALSNIVEGSDTTGNAVLMCGGSTAIINLMQRDLGEKYLSDCLLALHNMCGHSSPLFAIPMVDAAQHYLGYKCEILLLNALKVLERCSEESSEVLEHFIELGLVLKLLRLCKVPFLNVRECAIRIIGNFCSRENKDYIEHVLWHRAVDFLAVNLSGTRTRIIQDTLWCFSNILQSAVHARVVIRHHCMSQIVRCLQSPVNEVQLEAAWCISNATHHFTVEDVIFLEQNNFIETLCGGLNIKQPEGLSLFLSALLRVLRLGGGRLDVLGRNTFALKLEEIGELGNLENLQNNKNAAIYDLAVKIIKEIYGAEELE